MKTSIDFDKVSGLIHSLITLAFNVHLTLADVLLHGDEEVVYGNVGIQWIAK